jgi:hypothetical protein
MKNLDIAVVRPRVPFVPDYCVLTAGQGTPLEVLLDQAVSVARRESQRRFGDPRCYSLLCNAGRTRRSPWPHVHIVLAPDVRSKRRAMVFLLLKHVTRPSRWRIVRYLRRR